MPSLKDNNPRVKLPPPSAARFSPLWSRVEPTRGINHAIFVVILSDCVIKYQKVCENWGMYRYAIL